VSFGRPLRRDDLQGHEIGYPRLCPAAGNPTLRVSAQAPGAEFAGQVSAQTALRPHEEQGVDGFVRHPHSLGVRELLEQAFRDLLRRPVDIEFRFHVLPQPIVQRQFPQSRTPGAGHGETFSGSRTVAALATIAEHLPRNR